jgi:hypothetical protein
VPFVSDKNDTFLVLGFFFDVANQAFSMTFSISKMRFYFEVKVAFLLPLSLQNSLTFADLFSIVWNFVLLNSFSMKGIQHYQVTVTLKLEVSLVNLESPTQTSSLIFLLILHLSLGPIEQPQRTTQSP